MGSLRRAPIRPRSGCTCVRWRSGPSRRLGGIESSEVSTSDEWARWWKSRGDRDLALLLWAVWNPIGPVPLDEYASYGATIAGALRKAQTIGAQLVAEADEDGVQLLRNELRAETVDLLSTVLEKIRTTAMGIPPDRGADERAASIVFDWYEWSMQGLTAPD
jgi:hypothetical protein